MTNPTKDNNAVIGFFTKEELLTTFDILFQEQDANRQFFDYWQSGGSVFDTLMRDDGIQIDVSDTSHNLITSIYDRSADVMASRYAGKIAKNSQSFWDVAIHCRWILRMWSGAVVDGPLHLFNTLKDENLSLVISQALLNTGKDIGLALTFFQTMCFDNASHPIPHDTVPPWINLLSKGISIERNPSESLSALTLLSKFKNQEAIDLIHELWPDEKITTSYQKSFLKELAYLNTQGTSILLKPETIWDDLETHELIAYKYTSSNGEMAFEVDLSNLLKPLRQILRTAYVTKWLMRVFGGLWNTEGNYNSREICEALFGENTDINLSLGDYDMTTTMSFFVLPYPTTTTIQTQWRDEYIANVRERFNCLLEVVEQVGEANFRSIRMGKKILGCTDSISLRILIADRWINTIRKKQIIEDAATPLGDFSYKARAKL